jgi:hypothetical protein
MFNALIADHHAKQAALREENERLRRTAAESVGKVRAQARVRSELTGCSASIS